MGFLNTDSMPRLVEKLSDGANIKITGNSYGTRVSTVVDKITEKADNVTKAVEQEVVNEGYSFKVGTGDVDVSSSVEDSFGEIGVKGRTYQNLFKMEDTYGANLSYFTIIDNQISYKEVGASLTVYNDMKLLKPQTIYTLIVNCESLSVNSESNLPIRMNNNNSSYDINVFGLEITKIGITTFKFTTPTDVSNLRLLFYNNLKNQGYVFSGITILEGDHTSNTNLPSYFKGIVGVGDESKNLFKKLFADGLSKCSIAKVHDNGEFTLNGTLSQHYMFYITIPKGTYSTQVKQELGTTLHVFWTGGDSGFSRTNSMTYDVDTDLQCYIARGTYENTLCKYQIETGTTKSSYEPCYNGHKIEILSNGKNLLNSDKFTFFTHTGVDKHDYAYSISGGYMYGNSSVPNFRTGVKFKPNTKYRIKGSPIGNATKMRYEVQNFNSKFADSLYVTNLELDFEFTTPNQNSLDISFKVWSCDSSNATDSTMGVGNMILEEANEAISYTPYMGDKTQILLDEPLMKLPNGVADEITLDGKLIRRVGKIVFDGRSEQYWSYTGYGGHATRNTFEFSLNIEPTGIQTRWVSSLCEEFTPLNITGLPPVDNAYRISHSENVSGKKYYFLFCPSTDLIPHQDTTAWKQYLKENPVTVYYELPTPVITELPTPKVRIFKDGHITFNTLVAPTSTHKVVINKSAQIENSVREVQLLDGRVEELESFYDNLMIQTKHKLDLLNMDFEYAKTIESEDV